MWTTYITALRTLARTQVRAERLYREARQVHEAARARRIAAVTTEKADRLEAAARRAEET